MAFVPRYTKPDPNSDYYSTYNRFSWLDVAPYGGNCTGYAYGRSNEIAQRSLYNEFYITQSPGNASQWIYNSWPQYTHTSGTIDLHLGDILVWGGGTFGHVEIVEAISGTNVTCSGSVWGQTYGSSREFYTRTITYPSWGSYMGVWYDNDGNYHDYSNTFIGYIHNPYAGSGPTPTVTPSITITPSSVSLTMASDETTADATFNIVIDGIPDGESASGGNTYPGLTRTYNTGWSYTSYTGSDGNTYQRAIKTQTLEYEREYSYEYNITKYMYFSKTFSNGSISSTTPINIHVLRKKGAGILFLEWDGATPFIL